MVATLRLKRSHKRWPRSVEGEEWKTIWVYTTNLKRKWLVASAFCRVRLRQILDNLLSNAVKFTPAGGTVEVLLAQKAGYAVVTVRDSGVGFNEQFADKLFEPFTQEEQGPDRRVGGLGLGLAIASRLAKLQGASLSAASAGVNKGAMFTLKIPVADGSDEV